MSKLHRLLFVIDYLSMGGTERQLIEILKRINRDIFEVHLCCLSGKSSGVSEWIDKDMGIQPLIFDVRSTNSLSTLVTAWNLREYLVEKKIDIVQGFFLKSKLLGAISGKISGVTTISSIRDLGLGISRGNRIQDDFAHFLTDRFLVNSESIKEYLHSQRRIHPERIDVLPNGVDCKKFTPCNFNEKVRLRKTLGIGQQEIVFGMVANLRQVKRIDVFINAGAKILKNHPDVRFVIVGVGPLREELEALGRQLKIWPQLIFTGVQEDIRPFLGVMDVGVLCSDSEGFSNSILEYMAVGLPVIATDVGGSSEQVQDGWNGFLVSPGDIEGLQFSMEKLMDAELREKFSKNSVEKCHKNYDITHVVKRLEEYYMRLAAV